MKNLNKNIAQKVFLLPLFLFILVMPSFAHATVGSNSAVLTKGLVGYWSMDGKSTNWSTGQESDSSGSGNTGSLISFSTTTSPVVGKIGQAMNFNGSTNYISLTAPSLASASYTISGWVYENDLSTDRIWFSVGSSGSNNNTMFLRIKTDGSIDFGLWNNDFISSAGIFTARAWHHVSFTYNVANGDQKIYVDGVQKASRTGAVAFTGDTSSNIGRWVNEPGNFQYWFGSIDDVRIYNRALSANEVKELYNAGMANAAHTLAPSANQVTPLSKGLVGLWSMDGSTINWTKGTMSDLSGQGNTGQLVSMSTTTSSTIGKLGQALKFNGTSQYVDAGNASAVNFGTSDFSAGAWIKTSSKAGFPAVISKEHGFSTNGWNIVLDSTTGQLRTLIQDAGGAYTFPSSPNLTDNKWHYVFVTWKRNGNATGYVDGVNVGALDISAYSATVLSNGFNLTIGMQAGSTNDAFQGSIDNTRIYNRALSASEVKELYNTGVANAAHSPTPSSGQVTPLSSGLVGYWTLDGSQTNWRANTTADSSGNGNSGTLVSMSTSSSPTIGKIGQALQFNGSNQFVNISTTNIGSGTTNTVTMTAWVKLNSLSAYEPIFESRDNSGQGLLLSGASGSPLTYFWENSSDEFNAATGLTITPGKWYFVAVVITPTAATVYLNNATFVNTKTHNAKTINLNWTIAKDIAGSRFLNGSVDDVRLYNKALSPSQVQALYNAGH